MIEGILWKNKYNQCECDEEALRDYIERESNNFYNIQEFCKSIGVYDKYFYELKKRKGIEFEFNFKTKTNNANYKSIHQEYNWCYQKYIIEGLNHEEMAKEAKTTKRTIEKWCCEKHRLTSDYRKETKTLNQLQKDLIIGSLLGDGHIDKRETQPIFIVSHAINQKEYLYWKYEILKDLCNQKPQYYKGYRKDFKGKEYDCSPHYRLSSRIQNCLLEFRNKTKREIIDLLNEFSLSIYALDDWCRSPSNWNLCLAGICLEDRFYFLDILKNKFGLNAKISKDNRYAVMDAVSSRKLDNIILANINNNIDIVKNKILENKINKEQYRIKIKREEADVYLSDFCRERNINYKKIHKFHKELNLNDVTSILDVARKEKCFYE